LEYNNTVADNLVQFTVVDSLGRESDAGIGFVIDSSGLVATNFHVLAKAHIARAKFRRGRVHDIAGYRAYDEARDLAIVQLAGVPPGLTALKLHSGDLPRPGNKALTVGGISGASNSFAPGTISSVHTTNELPAGARHFLQSPDDNIWIQTDAVVAAGKTGGPVLNSQLQVIGVNTWSSESQKINFATSVRHLKVLLDQLKPQPFPFDVVNSAAGQVDKFKQHDPSITALLDEFQNKYEGFNSELQRQTKAGKSQQQIAQYVALNDPVPLFAKKFFTLADERRRQPQALEALASVCELLQLPGAYSAPSFQRATERILDEHLNDPKLGGMLFDITRLANDDALNLLRQLVQKSKEPHVVGPACYVLASLLQQIKPSRADREQEIVAVLQRASREFAEVPLRETTLGQAAQALLFDVKHLSIGKKAPEIVGTTLQGQELKLSDFAGKIVVIDFFADWNPACSAMYPQLRTLIDQLKDKPVAVLGVEMDTKERFQQLVGTNQVTWPCWWDGPDGPIATRWNVQNVPTVFVLDQQGTIRYKFVGSSGTSLTDALQYLLEGYKSSLPPELQPAAEGDLPAELDKLAAVVGTQPYPAVVNPAMLLIQAQRGKTTRQQLTMIEGWIQQGLELEPNSFSLQLARNRLQQFQGHTPEAVKQLRDMLNRKNLSKPEISTLRADLARLLVTQTERVDKEVATEALMLIEEAMFGGHTTEMLDTRAMAYLANNNILNARADMAAVLSNKPGPLAYFHSALIESAASNVQGAREALNRAFAEGLSAPQLTSFEQKQLQRLAKTLGVPLRK
jgi:peroxiredoxin